MYEWTTGDWTNGRMDEWMNVCVCVCGSHDRSMVEYKVSK